MPQLVPFSFLIFVTVISIFFIYIFFKHILPKLLSSTPAIKGIELFKTRYFPILGILIATFIIRFFVISLLNLYNLYYVYIYLIGLISIAVYVYICKCRNNEWSWRGIIFAWFLSTSATAIIFYIKGINIGLIPYLEYIDIYNILPTIQEYDTLFRNNINLLLNDVWKMCIYEYLDFFIPVTGGLIAYNFDTKSLLDTTLNMDGPSRPGPSNITSGSGPSRSPTPGPSRAPVNGVFYPSNSSVNFDKEVPEMFVRGKYGPPTLQVNNNPNVPSHAHARDAELIRLRNEVRFAASAPLPQNAPPALEHAFWIRHLESIRDLRLYMYNNYNVVADSNKSDLSLLTPAVTTTTPLNTPNVSTLDPSSAPQVNGQVSQVNGQTPQVNGEGLPLTRENLLRLGDVRTTNQEFRDNTHRWSSQIENDSDREDRSP